MSKNLEFLKKLDKNQWLVVIVVAGILVTGGMILNNSNGGFSLSGISILGGSDQKTAQKAVDYINSNQLTQTPAELVSVSRESGLVKVKIRVGTQEFDSYVTADGSMLFPSALNLNDSTGSSVAGGNQTPTPTATPATVAKSDNPELQVFVVSRCPYGMQMQRAAADAVKNIPELKDYIKIRYIGAVSSTGNTITAMHGDAEAQENLRQICIRDEQASKYWDYVSCDIQSGDSVGCEKSVGIDSTKLNACISDKSRGVAYAQEDFTLSDQFSVQGSPTMVLGNAQVDESGFGGRSSDGVKAMVCAAFNSAPSFCATQLNTAQAATAFSPTYAGAGGSAAPSAACAPAT